MGLTQEQIDFLYMAKFSGYAGGEFGVKPKIINGVTSYEIPKIGLDLVYVDRYAGGVEFQGQELLILDNAPIWGMVYHGREYEHLSEEQISFLKEALRNMPKEAPIRGPKKWAAEDLIYSFKMSGNMDYFTGYEVIKLHGRIIFVTHVMGGLVK